MNTVAALIDALGGRQVVAQKLNLGVTAIYNWEERGISFAYKPDVKALARKKKIKAPDHLFNEPKKRAHRTRAAAP